MCTNMNRFFYLLICSFTLVSTYAIGMPAKAQSFKEALATTYHSNPLLLAERARLREIDESYVQARAQGRLNANIEGTIGVARSSTGFVGSTQTNSTNNVPRTGRLTVIRPLYQSGRVSGAKDQAKANILSARQNLRNIEQMVLLSAATAYFDVLRDEAEANIRRNNVRVLSEQLIAARDRFNVGEGTRTDVAQAISRLEGAKIGLANAIAALESSRADFIRYIGHFPQSLSAPPQFILPDTRANAQMIGRISNPQILAARYNEKAAKAGLKIARAQGRPTIALNGTLQTAEDTGTGFNISRQANISAQINVPLWAGGSYRSQRRAAIASQTRTKFETRETERLIDQSIHNSWAQYQALKFALQSSQKQVEAAEIAFEGVKLEQTVGTRNTLDVLDAEQELLNAKVSVIGIERNLYTILCQLLTLMGGFDGHALQLPGPTYDAQENFKSVSGKTLKSDTVMQKLQTGESVQNFNALTLIMPTEGLVDNAVETANTINADVQ